ncbi:hypothetical protein O3S80_07060 [Streptomyces sp. Lzd4kr]|nr:hypothetical protein [Streptomyces sp. Lzd4kr]
MPSRQAALALEAKRAEPADRWAVDRYAQPAANPGARRDEVERLSAQRRRARAKADAGDRSRADAITMGMGREAEPASRGEREPAPA